MKELLDRATIDDCTIDTSSGSPVFRIGGDPVLFITPRIPLMLSDGTHSKFYTADGPKNCSVSFYTKASEEGIPELMQYVVSRVADLKLRSVLRHLKNKGGNVNIKVWPMYSETREVKKQTSDFRQLAVEEKLDRPSLSLKVYLKVTEPFESNGCLFYDMCDIKKMGINDEVTPLTFTDPTEMTEHFGSFVEGVVCCNLGRIIMQPNMVSLKAVAHTVCVFGKRQNTPRSVVSVMRLFTGTRIDNPTLSKSQNGHTKKEENNFMNIMARELAAA